MGVVPLFYCLHCGRSLPLVTMKKRAGWTKLGLLSVVVQRWIVLKRMDRSHSRQRTVKRTAAQTGAKCRRTFMTFTRRWIVMRMTRWNSRRFHFRSTRTRWRNYRNGSSPMWTVFWVSSASSSLLLAYRVRACSAVCTHFFQPRATEFLKPSGHRTMKFKIVL